MYIKTSTSYSLYVSHQDIPTFFQLNHSTERLLRALILYLTNHDQYQSSISILKWLIIMTNIHGFVPYFIKTGYADAALQWISGKRDIALQISDMIISLLHHLARHWMGVKALNKLKAIEILKRRKEEYLSQFLIADSNEESKDILLAYYLVYAVLLELKILKKENVSNIQTILERIIQAFHSPDLICGPYNVRKYLHCLGKTATNQSNNEHALIMCRAAQGILFNLDCIQMDVEPIEIEQSSNDQIKVMISYAHKDKTFCRKLVTNLQEHFAGDIWVDFNKLSSPYEDDWEEIGKAIMQCDVVWR